jgi:hypothetical protein
MSKDGMFAADEYRTIARNITDLVWSLLDKVELTPEEMDRLIHASYAARFHWGEFGEALDIARAEWHLVRANLKVGRPIPAFYHSQKILEVCQEGELGPFMVAYGYEATARSIAAIDKNDSSLDEYLRLAKSFGKKIEDEKERMTFFADLSTVPGYIT